jgi:hypothetical protein
MGMTDLTNAIIAKAADDYFNLLSGFIPPRSDYNVTEIEAFFRSDLYGLMTKVDCEYLMRKIKEEAAKMVLEYTVSKEKGSSQYYVCRVGEEKIPLTRRYTTKKKALHKAAEMQGLEYKQYMRIRRRDGADNENSI